LCRLNQGPGSLLFDEAIDDNNRNNFKLCKSGKIINALWVNE